MSSKNPYKSGGMFEGASHLIFANAKRLRKNMTGAEKVLWMHLKKGIDNIKIRRQHPIGLYIADFYCHKLKLIIEVDGSIHNEPDIIEFDEARQKDLEKWGYIILRFTNHQVMEKSDEVIRIITEKFLQLNNLQKHNTPQKAESKSPL
jgi:imidazole glycerol-phosphate synthase subunit HisF